MPRPEAPPLRRSMRLSDLNAVLAIEVRAYSYPWSRGNFIDSLAAGYLAEVLEDAQGQLLAYFLAVPGVDELHLLNLSVAPEHQGQGLGRLLMEALHRHAQARGLASLFLEVRASNQRAQALYSRLGYAQVGLRRAYYPAAPRREDAIVMRRLLPAAGQTGGTDVD
jgi:ribosomal-protein-alanine N-acetyltransferase